jgi:DNA-binding transcriptional LysR family regulator
MRTEALKTALKVVELKSFTRAGEVLFMAQVTVSQQIAALEKELGFRLFDRRRSKKGPHVIITPEGATFLLFASQAVRMLEEGVLEAVEERG